MLKSNLTGMLIAASLLVLISISYFDNPSAPYYVPLLFFFLISIIIGLFEIKGYFNKKNSIIVISLSLILMWGTIFIQTLSLSGDNIIIYMETGLITLFFIFVVLMIYKKSSVKG